MQKLKAYFRRKDALTQYAVAQQLGINRSAVTHWVKGRTKPAAWHLGKLSQITGIKIEDLL